MAKEIIRCGWCGSDPVYIDQRLFEMLLLEGAQAGLSWITILKRRETYRAAFDQFDAGKIARYQARKRERLLQDPGIIRNRLKVDAFITNAQRYLDVVEAFGDFDTYIWQFTDGKVLDNNPRALSGIPATTRESDAMSRDLKKRGFKFVGSTICYAYMQACGMVNDHIRDCFVRKQ